MMAGLPLFHRMEGRKVLLLGKGEAAEAKRRLLTRAGAETITDLPGAIEAGVRLAFIACEDRESAEASARQVRDAGMLANVVDQPDLCDFTTPSILERSPLVIAIGTGGASAGLAKHVRLRLEQIVPPSLGRLARALHAARSQLRAQWPHPRERRRALDAALQEGGPLDPFADDAHERVDEWLDDAAGTLEARSKGRIETILVTSADPDDLTLRAARWLGQADRVLMDGDIPEALLMRARADAERLTFSEADLAALSSQSGLSVILRWVPNPR